MQTKQTAEERRFIVAIDDWEIHIYCDLMEYNYVYGIFVSICLLQVIVWMCMQRHSMK